MIVLRIILLPFALLYGIGVGIRNLLFDMRAMRPVKFDFPVISVGNLSAGGTGKTPHVEYLLRLLLADGLKPATLSRGYRRKTKGFLLANRLSTHHDIGDEPLQYSTKFDHVVVGVDEDRIHGVISILKEHPELNAIVLDDAYQHRALQPGLSILLTEYNRPFFKDFLLPSGRLREWRGGYKRSDIIVVTKCPPDLNHNDRMMFTARIAPKPHQRVFFSTIQYGAICPLYEQDALGDITDMEVVLVTGIANPKPLVGYLKEKGNKVHEQHFPDHYNFKARDIEGVQQIFDNIASEQKLVLTTEKDAMRLLTLKDGRLKTLPFYYIEIEVRLLWDEERFKKDVVNYVRENQIDSEPFKGEDGE